jgi:predicted dienelactone hydrolase
MSLDMDCHKERIRLKIIRFLLFLWVPLVVGPSVYATQLKVTVGIEKITVHDPQIHSEIDAILWYPTEQRSHEVQVGSFQFPAALNALIQPGRHPLVMISHGSGGSPLGHQDTARFLVHRGYIVISVRHPHNNYLNNLDARKIVNWKNRPHHISAVLNYVLSHERFRAFINLNQIAVVGYSAGGYTALALVGGIPNTDAIYTHCRHHQAQDPVFCGNGHFLSTIRHFFSDLMGKDHHLYHLKDPRIKAAVLLAPLGVLFDTPASLSEVTVPIRIYRAEKDQVIRYPFHAESIRRKLPVKAEYIVVKNAGHFSFLTPLPDKIRQRVGLLGKDPAGFDRVVFHRRMNREIADFLQRVFAAQ